MSIWAFIYRVGWIALIALIVVGVFSMFWPKIREYQELQRQEARQLEAQRTEEEMLKHLKRQQERLRSDPRFVERIAREELGLVKPGDTVFRFVDEEPATAPRPSR